MDDELIQLTAKHSVKALLDLYEKGNTQGHSRHTVVEQEMEIIRGFVRSTKSKYEKLTTETHLTSGDPSLKRRVSKNRHSKINSEERKENNSHEEAPYDQHKPTSGETMDVKGQQKILETTVDSEKIEETKKADTETKESTESQNMNANLEKKDYHEVSINFTEYQTAGNTSDKPKEEKETKEFTPSILTRRKTGISPEMMLEKIKERSKTDEDIQVQRIQQKLSSALVENETTRIQKLIIDALEKDDDEMKPVKYVVKAIRSFIPSENSTSKDISFGKDDIFGVIEDDEEDKFKVKTIDFKIAYVPKEFTEKSTEDLLYMFNDDNRTPLSPTPSSSSSEFQLKSWSTMLGEKSSSFSKDERSRQEAIFEIISTEEAFVRDMQSIQKSFLFKLRTKIGEDITKEDLDILFSNLEEICAFSCELLAEMQSLQSSNNFIIPEFASCIKEKIQKFRIFAPFCSNLKRSLAHLKIKKTNQTFREFFESCEKSFQSQLNLESFLLKPLQRVTKWPLLIKGIIKFTPEENPDKAALTECLKMIEEVVSFVNNECGKADERLRLDGLQEQLDMDLSDQLGNGLLSIKKRKLLKEGPLQRTNPDMKVRAFLFNDLLILTKEDKERSKFKLYTRPLLLWMTDIQQTDPKKAAVDADDRNFVLNDQVEGVTFEFKAPSKRDKTLWLEEFGIALKSLKHNFYSLLPIFPLKDSKGETINPEQCLQLGDQYILAGDDGLYVASSGGVIKKTSSFKKKIQYFEVANDQVFILEGKSGALRIYPSSSLDPSAEVTPIKIEESKETIIFKTGKIGDETYLASLSVSKLKLFKLTNEAPAPLNVEFPSSFFLGPTEIESIDFIDGEVVMGSGQKFFTVAFIAATRISEIVSIESSKLTSTSQAKKAFQVGNDVLLCYSDMGLWKKGNYPSMMWTSAAKSFALRDEYLFVFAQNYIEIWEWGTGILIQAIKAPNSKSLNSNCDKTHHALVSILSPPNSIYLCKLNKFIQ